MSNPSMPPKAKKDYVLAGILAISVACFFLSPLIATPIGNIADRVLLERFEAAWVTSHDPSLAWQSLMLGENVFTAATIVIALLALICALWASWALYKQRV